MNKRILSILLALIMALGMSGGIAGADGDVSTDASADEMASGTGEQAADVSEPEPHNPAIIEVAADQITFNEWDEAPEIAVTVDGETLSPDSAKFLYNGSETNLKHKLNISIDAACSKYYSTLLGADDEYMTANGFAVNSKGLALLQYQLFICDKNGEPVDSYTRWDASADAAPIEHSEIVSPGWYILRVQCVGAADGYYADGHTISASTGWVDYRFFLMPGENDISWNLKNESTGRYARQDTIISVSGADKLIVECFDNSIGVNETYVSIDGGEQHKASDDVIDLSKLELTQGPHTLYIERNYVADGFGYPSGHGAEYYIFYNAASDADRRVTIAFEDEDGNTLDADKDWITEIDSRLHINVSGQSAISLMEWRCVYEDGYTVEDSGERSTLTARLKGHNNSSYADIYIAARNQDYSGDGDALNYAENHIRVRFKAEQDYYDEENRIEIEWVYDNPDSVYPTGYLRTVYDEQDKVIEKSYWNYDDSPATNAEHNYHKRVWIDKTDKYTECWQYDVDGKLTATEHGYAGYSINEFNNVKVQKYFGEDGKPTIIDGGYHYYVNKLDADGNILEQTYYGINNERVCRTDGIGKFVSIFDANGNETDTWLYNESDEPFMWNDKYFHLHVDYDEDNNVISRTEFDADDVPTDTYGYVTEMWEYIPGTNGVLKRHYYLNADGGKAVNSELGYYSEEHEYENGHLVSTQYYGIDGNLTLCADGYAVYKREYNAQNLLIHEAYYDADGVTKVNVNVDGDTWSDRGIEYDSANRQTLVYYLAADGYLTNVNALGGAAELETTYSEYGSTTFYYDEYGKPTTMLENVNYYGQLRCYDGDNNNVLYTMYLGADRKPIVNEKGFFLAKTVFNAEGQAITEERYQKGNDKLADDMVSKVEWTYDDDGNIIQIDEYKDPDLTGVNHIRHVYGTDPDGKTYRQEVIYYHGDDKAANEYGVWKYVEARTVDDLSGEYKYTFEYQNTDDALTFGWNGGYASMEVSFDGQMHDNGFTYDDIDGYVTMIERENSVANLSNPYEGTFTVRWFGKDGQPMLYELNDTTKVHAVTVTVTQNAENGYAEYKTFYGIDGEKLDCSRGYSTVITTLWNEHELPEGFDDEYDYLEHLTHEYLNSDDAPVMGDFGDRFDDEDYPDSWAKEEYETLYSHIIDDDGTQNHLLYASVYYDDTDNQIFSTALSINDEE